jgi:ABC-type lipoprotein release transport system permease subunit
MYQPPPKKGNGLVIGLIAAIAVLVLAGVVVLVLFFTGVLGGENGGKDGNNGSLSSNLGNAEAILREYIEAYLDPTYAVLRRHSAFDLDRFIEEAVAISGNTLRDFNQELDAMFGVRGFEEFVDTILNTQMKQNLEWEYGSNYRVTIGIRSPRTISQREFDDIIDDVSIRFTSQGIPTQRVININGIEEIVEYTVELTIRGSRGEDTDESPMYMARINGQWKVLDTDVFYFFAALAY